MHINEKFNENRPVFSFEVFPPKKNSASVESIYQAISELQELKPDFISVTYGAGGNPSDTNTRDIAAYIKDNYHIDTMAHLTCVNADKDSIDSILRDLSSAEKRFPPRQRFDYLYQKFALRFRYCRSLLSRGALGSQRRDRGCALFKAQSRLRCRSISQPAFL